MYNLISITTFMETIVIIVFIRYMLFWNLQQ